MPPVPPKEIRKYIAECNTELFKIRVDNLQSQGYELLSDSVKCNNFDGSWFGIMVKYEY